MRYSDGEYNRGKQSWDFVRNNHFERDYRMSKGTEKGKNNGIAVLVIFMVIGFAMAIGGIVMTVDRKHKDSYYGTATGKITDISHHKDSDGDDMYAAVYTYYVDDIEYTFTDDTSVQRSSFYRKESGYQIQSGAPGDRIYRRKSMDGSHTPGHGYIVRPGSDTWIYKWR